MANSDLFQVNPIPNQYGVYLDLVYCNFPEMVDVNVAEKPLLRLDRHQFILVHMCLDWCALFLRAWYTRLR
jgi:hypothetical protein